MVGKEPGTVLPDDEVVRAVEGELRHCLPVLAVETGMPAGSSTSPAGVTRAP